MSLLGAVLAGGGSRRFRSPKTLARLHGAPLWQVAGDRLQEVCDDVVAVVNHPQVAQTVELETLPDRRPLTGPLGGIDAALARAVRGGHDAVLVLAVDMPWVRTEALRMLADAWREHGRTTLPRAGPPWGFHPLCGVYPLAVLGALNSAFAERRLKSGAFANSLDPVVVDTGLQPWDFRSVNHQADLPPPAVSIVGNKKSGKTTLSVAVIGELVSRGRRVMSVKHGHNFRLDTAGTDSWRHRHDGGAERVLLAGPGEFALLGGWGTEGEPPLDLLLSRHLAEAEIVVVEGFRRAGLPKIEVFRAAVQPEPVFPPEQARDRRVLAAVTDSPGLPWSVPVLSADAPDVASRVADLIEAGIL